MIHAEVRSKDEQREGEKFVHKKMYLVDAETGERLDDKEIRRAFKSFNIIGVHVKPKRTASVAVFRENGWPGLAKITGYTDTHVILNDNARVPKDDFHLFYKLD